MKRCAVGRLARRVARLMPRSLQLGDRHLGSPLIERDAREDRLRVELRSACCERRCPRTRPAVALTSCGCVPLSSSSCTVRLARSMSSRPASREVDRRLARRASRRRGTRRASRRRAARRARRARGWGSWSKKTRGLMSFSARDATTLNVISRKVWLASGSATMVSYAVAAAASDREQRDRAEQAEQADAARLHRDELAVGRQPAEPDQDPEQHAPSGCVMRERLRQQRQQHAARRSTTSTPLAISCSAWLQNRRDHRA